MAHMIDTSNQRSNIAFLGNRNNVWHRLGQEMPEGQSIEAWAKAAGLDWTALEVPAYAHMADVVGNDGEIISKGQQICVEGSKHIVRNDTLHPLGYVSDRYKPVQPAELLAWFEQYISVDDRFKLDVAGSLKCGEIIWATATYNGDIKVGGDKHVARILMTTTYDGTGATINQATMTRVVCNNTLKASLSSKKGMVKTRHNTKFNAEAVGKELGNLAQSINEFKKMGDAMSETHMAKETVSLYFKKLLDIPFDMKSDDVSTRKLNMFGELNDAYKDTVSEGTQVETKWCALNAVTRYVDHTRTVREGNGGNDEARFLSSQFGSGAAMKEQAVRLLTVEDEFEALVKATPMQRSDDDVLSLLKAPFRV